MQQQSNNLFNGKKINHSIKTHEGNHGLGICKSLLKEKFKLLNQKKSSQKNIPKLRLFLFKNQKKRLMNQILQPKGGNCEKYSLNNLKGLYNNKIYTISTQNQDFSAQVSENMIKSRRLQGKAEWNIQQKISKRQQTSIDNNKQYQQTKMMRENVKMINKNDLSQNTLKQCSKSNEFFKNIHIILFKHQKESQRQTSQDEYNSLEISQKDKDINNLNLEIESIIKSKMTFSMPPGCFSAWNTSELSTAQKIENHFSILERMSLFVEESRNFYDVSEQWLALNFLVYKKYYQERMKAINFMNKYPMNNPFIIQNAKISSKEIIQFMKTQEGNSLKAGLQIQNTMIKKKYMCYYNQFNKAKVGDRINLTEPYSFSHYIIKELWDQFILTQFSSQFSDQKRDIHLCKILQMIFLICELNGKHILSFHKAQYALLYKHEKEYIIEGKLLYEKHILYKQY